MPKGTLVKKVNVLTNRSRFFIPVLFLAITIPLVLQAQLGNTPWPMISHDLQHTGRSPYIGPDSPVLKWSYTTGGNLQFDSPVIDSGGTIYIGSYDEHLYALNSNGTLKWSEHPPYVMESSAAIDLNGNIYFGPMSPNGELYGVNSSGGLIMAYNLGSTGGMYASSPAIGSDGTIYIGSEDNKLYAINPNGTLSWSYTTGGLIESSPAISSDSSKIYIGSHDDKLYAINSNGTLYWSYPLPSMSIYESESPSIGSDGTIYIGTFSYAKLYAINPNGTLSWSYTTGGQIDGSPAIGSDSTIYIGSNDAKLYAINSNGTLKWSYLTGADVWGQPAIDAAGTIYVGSTDDRLYAINSDGTLKWSYKTGNQIYSGPAIGSDGTIYVGSYDDKLYAIGPGPGGIQEETKFPQEWGLIECFPNPFIQKTVIEFSPRQGGGTVESSELKDLRVEIYDLGGRLVRTLTTGHSSLATAVSWDGTDNRGQKVKNGIYFIQLSAENYKATKKVTILK